VRVMKGIIESISFTAEIVDLTRGASRHDVVEAMEVMVSASARYFPGNTIFVCIVEPGVESERKALLIKTRNYYSISPDNGCLTSLAIALNPYIMCLKSSSAWRRNRIFFTTETCSYSL